MTKHELSMSRLTTVSEVREGMGRGPAIILVNPKYAHNAATILRSAWAFGFRQLWITGDRVVNEWVAHGRLHREERSKSYLDVQVFLCNRPFQAFPRGTSFIGAEVVPTAIPQAQFMAEKLSEPVFVFGPEDGSLGKVERRFCHQFVLIPSRGCLNLGVAAGIIMSDWVVKRQQAGIEPVRPSYATLDEHRGFIDSDEALAWE